MLVTIASEAPVLFDLPDLERIDLRSMVQDDSTVRSWRSRIRYLSALWPDKTVPQLAETISAVIGGYQLSLSDVRMILEGRQLDDVSKLTAEVPVSAIQSAGRVLAEGGTQREASRRSGLSVDTVQRIDEYLGLSRAVDERRMDIAVAGVAEGWSCGRLAKVLRLSRSSAHRYMGRARAVLVEIGDMS